MEERMKYVYDLHPVALVHFPQLKALSTTVLSRRVFQVQASKNLQEDEWLYQVEKETGASDWNSTFEQLVAATSAQQAQSLLQQYLSDHPDDELALRLKDRLALWVPGRGIRV
eukprot:GGOE01031794.1.p1 GENE.GGOE01031794.1~~GGOE01031794.1.p1  ORF type:complete len:113 (-),score=46.95 GGOE01031794.1:263-601(-)